jgi:hypothetical protein
MDRYAGPHTALSKALHGGLYLDIIMDLYEWPHTSLTIDMHGGLYSHYNGPLWMTPY